MSKEAIWDIAAHTSVKHDLLRTYLGAWFPILGKFNRRVVFMDGFAGPGRYLNGEPGSPAIALGTFLDHNYAANLSGTEYIFVFTENHAERFASLEQVVEAERVARGGWPEHVKVIVENKNFTEVAEDILGSLGHKDLAPTFAFLDPFGYKDVPMDVIRRLMSYSKSELFIYFDINSLNRFATAGQQVDVHFEALYGTTEFKNAPAAGDPGRQQFLHDLYERQLKNVCGFKHVRSFEMLGANGKAINYLFFCTNSSVGFDRMKGAMWKAAPSGDFRFRDSLGGQPVLFQPEPDTAPLQSQLLETFAGKTVDISTLADFVVTSTPYVSSHLKTRTLVPLQLAGKISSPNQRRPKQFPPGTQVTFPSLPAIATD
ncbi:three-Cys-motif partner protein TcmP [Frondihabitans sp. 4ASC-45]|uniref:three-Cys-motif partner protein TcmP n=1 Tax=Frondihabitans sp. 4ASC-45 TaxID=3111636 RepID=UPI003C17DABB